MTGEIRSVSKIEQRVKEAAKLGFKRVFIPKNNKDGWEMPDKIEVIGCTTLSEAIKKAFI